MANKPSLSDALLDTLAGFKDLPYDFVLWAYPWGEEGTDLEKRQGPNKWQTRFLRIIQVELVKGTELSQAIQIAVKSGHDVGKTAALAWIAQWAMTTAVDTRGRVTANTEKQLRSILWVELAKWHRLFIARQFFEMSATRYCSSDPEHKDTWRLDAMPWSEDNPDAFSGLHNFGKRILILFDEASGIADSIWERTDGVTREANTEVIWVVCSNPTKNFGRFYDCFDKFADTWVNITVDSREVEFTNKLMIAKAISDWGEDSDYVKVRFLGEFPSTSMLQLIPLDAIKGARKREVQTQSWEPLILSLDVARFGNNESVALFRRGRDTRSLPCHRWRGLSTIETGTRLAGLVAQYSPDAVFIDEGGVGGGVVDFVRHLGHTCIGVNFGSSASTRPGGALVSNKRAEMFVSLRDWLRDGGCIEDSDELEEQLISIEYHFDKKSQIQLMSKEDMRMIGRPSPDWGDALAMTFAYPVSARSWRGAAQIKRDYDPLAHSALPAFDHNQNGPSFNPNKFGDY